VADNVTVYVPSGAVPAAPRFAVDVPADWVAGASAGAMVMFQIADRPAWSVVVSSLRVGADTTLRDVAVRTFARQRQQHPDAQIRVQRTGRFGTRLTYLREVALPAPSGDRPLAQFHAMFVVPAGSTEFGDVMSIAATCPDGELSQLGPAVVEMVSSLRLEER